MMQHFLPGRNYSFPAGKGPRILFFSGGSALKDVSRELINYTSNSIHIITTFDSGGSSATLRKAFEMPAVGDLRSRIMALADPVRIGNSEIFTLFAYRLPVEDSPRALKRELASLVQGRHPLIKQIPKPMKGIIQEHLTWFAMYMPEDFSLGGANVGNLILSAGFLKHKRRLNPVIAQFSRMVRARGIVRPICSEPADLAVLLESGEVITGQHNFTGKEAAAITSPIIDIWLTPSIDSAARYELGIDANTARLIGRADLICYPVGSFYSSLIANLLPSGVGNAIAANPCPKIFTPNIGNDPELAGHTLWQQIEQLLKYLLRFTPNVAPTQVLSMVLVDPHKKIADKELVRQRLAGLGIKFCEVPLIKCFGKEMADARLFCEALKALNT